MLKSPATQATSDYDEAEQVEFKTILQQFPSYAATFQPGADRNFVVAHYVMEKLREERRR